jgi:hypothetical protein
LYQYIFRWPLTCPNDPAVIARPDGVSKPVTMTGKP